MVETPEQVPLLFQSYLLSSILAGIPTARLPEGISLVTTVPAPVSQLSPILTGATSIVSHPMKLFDPIFVGCFDSPS